MWLVMSSAQHRWGQQPNLMISRLFVECFFKWRLARIYNLEFEIGKRL